PRGQGLVGRRAQRGERGSACPGSCFSQEKRMAAGYVSPGSGSGGPWENRPFPVDICRRSQGSSQCPGCCPCWGPLERGT
uniref:Uncharacterized protein n=1 Tax=Lynx canadensis TaxID=61383 RepID=A0A667FU97_LYNCA